MDVPSESFNSHTTRFCTKRARCATTATANRALRSIAVSASSTSTVSTVVSDGSSTPTNVIASVAELARPGSRRLPRIPRGRVRERPEIVSASVEATPAIGQRHLDEESADTKLLGKRVLVEASEVQFAKHGQ
jgi:hypothetical protein